MALVPIGSKRLFPFLIACAIYLSGCGGDSDIQSLPQSTLSLYYTSYDRASGRIEIMVDEERVSVFVNDETEGRLMGAANMNGSSFSATCRTVNVEHGTGDTITVTGAFSGTGNSRVITGSISGSISIPDYTARIETLGSVPQDLQGSYLGRMEGSVYQQADLILSVDEDGDATGQIVFDHLQENVRITGRVESDGTVSLIGDPFLVIFHLAGKVAKTSRGILGNGSWDYPGGSSGTWTISKVGS